MPARAFDARGGDAPRRGDGRDGVNVLQGGVVTKHDLDLTVARLDGRIDGLENKINLVLVVAVLVVLAPAVARLPVG